MKTLQVTINDGQMTEFFRTWALPDAYSEPLEFRQLLTRLQSQVNTFVKNEEEANAIL